MPNGGGQPEPGSNPYITMGCDNFVCHDMGTFPSTLPSDLVIAVSSPFCVSVDFHLAGAVWPALLALAAAVPGGDFRVTYRYESQGAGPEGTLGTVNVAAVAGKLQYAEPETKLTVPAGVLPVGVYKLVAVVNSTIPALQWVTGFYEGPMIQIY